jgi:hypothetical protein
MTTRPWLMESVGIASTSVGVVEGVDRSSPQGVTRSAVRKDAERQVVPPESRGSPHPERHSHRLQAEVGQSSEALLADGLRAEERDDGDPVGR